MPAMAGTRPEVYRCVQGYSHGVCDGNDRVAADPLGHVIDHIYDRLLDRQVVVAQASVQDIASTEFIVADIEQYVSVIIHDGIGSSGEALVYVRALDD